MNILSVIKYMESVLGSTFINKDGEVPFSDLEKYRVIGLYFTAKWCPPCCVFNPSLLEFYNDVNYPQKRMEIIQVSSDKDATSFIEYFGKMPWLSFPFRDPRIRELKDRFQVPGIPLLLILNNDGSLAHGAARADVENDGPNCFDRWLSLIT